MSDVSSVLDFAAHPDKLDDAAVELLSDVVGRYPYFGMARILYLAGLKCTGSDKYVNEYAKALLYLPGRDMVERAVGEVMSKRESALLQSDRTMCALNDFLGEAQTDEILVPESPVSSDYLSAAEFDLEADADHIGESDTDKLLAAFLSADNAEKIIREEAPEPEREEAPEPEREEAPEPEREEGPSTDKGQHVNEELFTETLADIYIRQHRYEDAVEIIRYLYLNFPNKSCYFADQIRFLETLIKVNKQKNN